MSTSPTFKYRGPDKRCPFPFNRDAATSPGLSYDYVTLTETDGDEGLAEACRLWWLLDTVDFTHTATYTLVVSPYTVMEFDIPSGCSGSNGQEPYERASRELTTFANGSAGYEASVNSTFECIFKIAYVSGEWRLYYYFYFGVIGIAEGYTLNPAYGGVPAVGSFSLFGYTLDYTVVEVMTTSSGITLSATSSFYTLV